MTEKKTDKSYGVVGLTRWSSSKNENFFGTDVKSSTGVKLSISQANIRREGSQDYIFDEQLLIEVELSPIQFADMVTNMNVGCGVPCTIKAFKTDEKIEHYKYEVTEPKVDLFKKEYNEKISSSKRLIKNAQDIIKTSKLSKKEQESIGNLLFSIGNEIDSNSHFIRKQFEEFIDLSTMEAKKNVDYHIENTMISLGKEKLQEVIESGTFNISLPETTDD